MGTGGTAGPSGNEAGTEGSSGGGDTGSGSEVGASAGTDPGFGGGGAAGLPSMVDVLPTFDEPVASSSTSGGTDSEGGAEGSVPGEAPNSQTGGSGSTRDPSTVSDSGTADAGNGSPGTRADGGLTGDWETDYGVDGPLTAIEQVAILDGQLRRSTDEFDGMIREEQARQREASRSRSTSEAASGAAGNSGDLETYGGRNPYDSTGVSDGSIGGGMGGTVARAPTAPDNPAIYEVPEDIPMGNDDDVVARQLREAAMREPDPAVRAKLWNEYRKYKGLEVSGE